MVLIYNCGLSKNQVLCSDTYFVIPLLFLKVKYTLGSLLVLSWTLVVLWGFQSNWNQRLYTGSDFFFGEICDGSGNLLLLVFLSNTWNWQLLKNQIPFLTLEKALASKWPLALLPSQRTKASQQTTQGNNNNNIVTLGRKLHQGIFLLLFT
jgi:hypothetical protein